MRDHVFTVTGGTVTGASPVQGRLDRWDITVRPTGAGDVRVILPGTESCQAEGAVCTEDERPLRTGLWVLVPRAELTVAAESVPDSHDGETRFAVQLAFSEAIATGGNKLRNALLASGGTITSVQRVDGRTDLWAVTIDPAGIADVLLLPPPPANCNAEEAVCTADGGPLQNGAQVLVPRAGLTARFGSLPDTHDGETAFTALLRFSEPVSTSYKTVRDQAMTVSEGQIAKARRVSGRSDLWEITIVPSSGKDIAVSLPATGSCEDEGAMCTREGRALESSALARVRGPSPLSARFESAPGTHDGETALTVAVVFSEPVAPRPDLLRRRPFSVNGGTLTGVAAPDDGGLRWEVAVEPSGTESVSISLAALGSCVVRGAVCTHAGKPLAEAASISIPGPSAFTAQLEGAPSNHDGSTPFNIRLTFSEATGLGYTTVRDDALEVAGGTITKARRIEGMENLGDHSPPELD